MHKAVHAKNVDIAKSLIDAGVNLNSKDSFDFSALQWAQEKCPKIESLIMKRLSLDMMT